MSTTLYVAVVVVVYCKKKINANCEEEVGQNNLLMKGKSMVYIKEVLKPEIIEELLT